MAVGTMVRLFVFCPISKRRTFGSFGLDVSMRRMPSGVGYGHGSLAANEEKARRCRAAGLSFPECALMTEGMGRAEIAVVARPYGDVHLAPAAGMSKRQSPPAMGRAAAR